MKLAEIMTRSSARPASNTPSRSHDLATLDLLPDLICLASPSGHDLHFNQAWLDYAAAGNPILASERWLDLVVLDDRKTLVDRITDASASLVAFETDVRILHPMLGARWFMVRGTPRVDKTGQLTGWLFALTDIDRRKRFKLELQQKAKDQAFMLDVSVDCIKLIGLEGELTHLNKAGCEALNVTPDSGFGMNWLGLLPEAVRECGATALEKARNRQVARFLGQSQVPGESMRYWDNMLTPIVFDDGHVEAILCVSRDVTQQLASERRIELLLHELNHRSKNMLAVIQALIKRSVPDEGAEFARTLDQRIAAIVKNQDVLIHGEWDGATARNVISAHMATLGGDGDHRIRMSGPNDLLLRAEAAETIGLAMHELTTNALKYGALSNETGTVTVTWGMQDSDVFAIEWRESGGPPVAAPSRRGFGSVVIERHPRMVIGATADCRYEPSGLVWKLEAPMSRVLVPTPLESAKQAMDHTATMDA